MSYLQITAKYAGCETSKIIKDTATQYALKAILNNRKEETVMKNFAKNEKCKEAMLIVMKKEIKKETNSLVGKKSNIFKRNSPCDLKGLDWIAMNDELKIASPYLHHLLSSVLDIEQKKNIPIFMTAVSVLLYGRSQLRNMVQSILGLVLDKCGLTKEVINVI